MRPRKIFAPIGLSRHERNSLPHHQWRTLETKGVVAASSLSSAEEVKILGKCLLKQIKQPTIQFYSTILHRRILYSSHAVAMMHAVFYPSKLLHCLQSRRPPSTSSSNIIEEDKKSRSPTNPLVVICYKDRISFYKSTRKVRCTATRIWPSSVAAAVSDEEAVCVVRNAYYIGKRILSPSLSLTRPHPAVFDEDDEETASICECLTFEFGNSCDTTILTLPTTDDEYDLHVTNFNSDEKKLDNEYDRKSQNNKLRNNINVIFIDLDAILEKNDNSCDGIDHFHLIQTILTSSVLIQNNNEDRMGGGSIVHIQSEVLYRITTMNNTIGAKER